jgi:hypothetical protein
MAKLDLDEKLFMRKIAALARKDKDTIRDVMLALLKMCTIEFYSGKKEIIIPHICRLKISVKQVQTQYSGIKEEVVLEATPARAFIEEFFATQKGVITPTEKYLKRQIDQKFQDLLKIVVTDKNIKEHLEKND